MVLDEYLSGLMKGILRMRVNKVSFGTFDFAVRVVGPHL